MKEELKTAEQVVYQNILTRESIRQYEDRPVEKEKIEMLLHAGMAAPSGQLIIPIKTVALPSAMLLTCRKTSFLLMSSSSAIPGTRETLKTNGIQTKSHIYRIFQIESKTKSAGK